MSSSAFPKYDYGQPTVDVSITVNTAALKGNTALVTGGGSGLGRAYVERLASLGVYVVCVDLNDANGAAVVAGVTASGGKALFVKADMTKWDDQLNAFKATIEWSPTSHIHYVIANAGIMPPDPMSSLEDKDGDPTEPDLLATRVNLLGPMYTAKLANHYFQRNGPDEDRCLILKSSLAAYLDIIGYPQYNVSKFGVRGLMCSLRSIADKTGVRTNLVAPWTIRTAIMPAEAMDHMQAVSFLADIEDAVDCIVFIISQRLLNGRSFAILPRQFEKNGFVDIATDDHQGSPLLQKLLKEVTSVF